MANVLEMAAEIVAAHASSTVMSKEDILAEIQEVYATLSALEKGEEVATKEEAQEDNAPALSKRKAFGKNQIFCMICGKGFTTLKRHLTTAHEMTAKEYRNQFNIPAGTPLAAKAYSESRKQMAIDRDLAGGLAKARAAKVKAKKK
jgi:predicted transcriptional regulator